MRDGEKKDLKERILQLTAVGIDSSGVNLD